MISESGRKQIDNHKFTKVMTEQWWIDHLKEFERDGANDFDKGIRSPPYPDDEDPQNQEENAAYLKGWWGRRKELQRLEREK